MCLALESSIALPSQYLVPAVQSRIQDLLSHNSPQVRRRAIHACRVLSQPGNNLLLPVSSILLKGLSDTDHTVTNAALLAVSSPLFRDAANGEQLSQIRLAIRGLAFGSDTDDGGHPYHLNALLALDALAPADQDVVIRLPNYVYQAAKVQDLATLWALFQLLSRCQIEQLKTNFQVSPISYIRDLLESDNPNLCYLFLTCIGSLDAALWAGSTEEFPSVLDAQEVERIMRLMESPDALIRTKTLSILMAVDHNILDLVYARLLQSFSNDANVKTQEEHVTRLLEVLDTKVSDDGEMYARGLADLFASVNSSLSLGTIFELAVVHILSRIQYADPTFQVQCAAALIAPITEPERDLRATMLVIIAALVVQYSKAISIPPATIVSGLVSRLPGAPAAVQDACILAMLSLAADCDIPDDVQSTIINIHDGAGRHIRKRCKQFQALHREKKALQDIVKQARGSSTRGPSLPDFLVSLESYEIEKTREPQAEPDTAATESSRVHKSELRYDAYDTPQMTPKLRALKHLRARAPAKGESEVHVKDEPLLLMADSMSRLDLIGLDEPAPSPLSNTSTFLSIWNSAGGFDYDARGWNDNRVSDLVGRLQALKDIEVDILPTDEEPFSGEAKLLIRMEPDGVAVLKFRESEEDGTLWRLRTGKAELGRWLKAALARD